MVGLFDERLPLTGTPLLSFKVSEFSDVEREHLAEILTRASWRVRVFLHDWAGTEAEERIVRDADVVYCGNHYVHDQVRELNSRQEILWSPGWSRRPPLPSDGDLGVHVRDGAQAAERGCS